MFRSEEDYLKLLLRNGAEKNTVSNSVLADKMNHSPQTVNEMVKRLEKKGFVTYKPYKGSVLTKEGVRVARNLIKKHRLWEIFMYEKLGYSWDEIHEEAEVLEHATSDKLMKALFEYLGKPEYCPHGSTLEYETVYYEPLSEAEDGRYILKQVDDMSDIVTLLDKIALRPGCVFEMRSFTDGQLITFNNTNHILSKDLASKMYVEETNKKDKEQK